MQPRVIDRLRNARSNAWFDLIRPTEATTHLPEASASMRLLEVSIAVAAIGAALILGLAR